MIRSVYYNFSCSSNATSNNSARRYVIKTDRNSNGNRTYFIDKLKDLKTSRNMKEFLEKYVRWKVKIYDAEDFYNSATNTSNNFNLLLFARLCATCNNSENDPRNISFFVIGYLDRLYLVILTLGLVCIFGNGITISQEIKSLVKRKLTGAKERKVYRILVLNLCVADFLMGVYLIIGAIGYKIDPKNVSLCNVIGVITSLSMQTSATILTTITAYRLKSILFPYKLISVKFIAFLLVVIWFAWAIIVSLPLFNETLFRYEFTKTIIVNRSDGAIKIELHRFISSIQTLVQAVNCTTYEPFCQLLNALPHFLNNEVAIQLLKSFNFVDFNQEETDFLNFYHLTGGCTVPIIFEAKKITTVYFSFFLIFFNLLEYLFILIAYVIMCLKISTSRFKKFCLCISHKNSLKEQRPEIPQIIFENKLVYTRIFVVVVTDLICGMLICLIGVTYYFDSFSYNCVTNRNFRSWAILIAMLLFPLNSIINPYIYSFRLWKKLLKRCKQLLLQTNFNSARAKNSCVSKAKHHSDLTVKKNSLPE